MTDTLPGADPLSLSAQPSRTVYLVTDALDEVTVTRRLAALESSQCVVVRPNPVRSASDLVWDVLTAAGKNPAAARSSRLTTGSAWAAAAAWLTAARTEHIVVERGHRLSEKEAVRLAELADTVDATLWLIWSSPRDATEMGNALESSGHSRLHGRRGKLPPHGPNRPLHAIHLEDFYRLLPLSAPATSLPPNPDENPGPDDDWPTLPDVDFPLFLAACRRHLAADTFDQLNHVYRSEAQRTDQFVRRRPRTLTAPRTGNFDGALNAYLRDERLGPAATPRLALIRLRAIQASLLSRGVLLRWQPASLGPAPADRLPTWLTPAVCRALRATVPTDAAAATVLSLHLSAAPDTFSHLLCRNIDEDGHYLYLPTLPDHAIHLRADWAHAIDQSEDDESPGHGHTIGKTPLPPYAAEILAAQLAYRRAEGSGTRRHLFVNYQDPALAASERTLTELILRTCRRIGIQPHWLHRGTCREDGQIGTGPSPQTDWMTARRLTVTVLDDQGGTV
ncbi:hypothetical protein [Streptomyces sp. HYC2]|uniref:hypothetical protein n=1 Tax=Streptomyces sp. HYC2 TaxID=2955207 RepID=UPI002480EFEB|nr:hypothetical protein [Streptomyces sp. HYC2]